MALISWGELQEQEMQEALRRDRRRLRRHTARASEEALPSQEDHHVSTVILPEEGS